MSSFKKGGMIVLSSPSGAGKTTLVKKISKYKNFVVSISHTTRTPRPNEKNGKDYFFISKNNFKKLIKKNEFLEHAKVFDNYYGSSKRLITEKLKRGKNIVFDIDWQGTRQIKNKKLNYKLVTIFILPPSKLIVTPVKYFILLAIIDFIKSPISSTLPKRPRGSFFSRDLISGTSSFILSVAIGPGAIFIVVTFLFAYSLLKHFNTLVNATL